MLVLSRRQNESIVVCDDILVTVVEIRGDTVQIGIEAPPDIPVLRSEVLAASRRAGARDSGDDDPRAASQ